MSAHTLAMYSPMSVNAEARTGNKAHVVHAWPTMSKMPVNRYYYVSGLQTD